MQRNAARAGMGELFEQVFGWTAAVTDELAPADVEGWDSLAHVTLVFAIEKRFGIKFTGAEIANAATAGDLIDLVVAKTAGTGMTDARSVSSG